MAISTGGFGVNVIPQYTPVDPSLASFNPAEITKGMLNHFQMAGTVAQLQAFKQHAQEIADTEAIRTQILKQKAEQEKIDLDLKQRTHEAEVAALGSELKGRGAKGEATAKVAPLQATRDVGALGSEIAMQPDLLELAQLKAKIDKGGLQFQQTMQPFAQEVDRYKIGAELAAAPVQYRSAVSKAMANEQEAARLLNKATNERLAGVTDEESLLKAKIVHENAQAKLAESTAALNAYKQTPEAKRRESIMELDQVHKALKMAQDETIKVGQTDVPNPNDPGMKIKLSQLYGMVFKEDPTGPDVVKKDGINILGSVEKLQPGSTEMLTRYRDALDDEKNVRARARVMASELFKKQPDSGLGPPSTSAIQTYWTNPKTGKFELKPQ